MSLEITRALEALAVAACETAYPEEGCGLLIGPVPPDLAAPERAVVVDEVRPLANGWDASAKTNRYAIDPRELARVEAALAPAGRGVVGFFHSHPDAPAWPSPFDLALAWPCVSYWILRVDQGRLSDSRSWRRSDDGRSFVEEAIHLEG
ncbi:MAG: M67 family metallopeptidase [Elusimicrobia bacterium]|nr:M67 family metallopeptidase [Elusimicrobiota bacterium]